ncbi:hypothetical protein HY624_03370 [Candidatus Uhrbacteria bacterium]|nr:hypothetical protein [Candidatus Uhrbacteria bacterium]
MSSFAELTKLLEEDATHRLIIIREDGSPIGVLMTVAEYRRLMHEEDRSEAAPLPPVSIEPQKNPLDEWDTMMEKVSGAEKNKEEEDTYLFEPVE